MLNRYELPEPERDASPGFWKRHGWWLVPLLVFDVLLLAWCARRDQPDATTPPAETVSPATESVADTNTPAPAGLVFGYPTAQHQLLMTNAEGVYMPTASGRIESALYGSVRTTQQGKYYLPSFHEGLDIAPLARDRKNMPTDPILAAADGRVLYVNRIAGNSNYGKYVVLGHPDPAGEIYTLYAHLADVPRSLKIGDGVARGQNIGLMGNSASTGLPVVRAHLHFEVGVINNLQFHRWFKAQKLKPDHGNFHGHNLTGLNPADVYRWQDIHPAFNLGEYLATLPPSFELAVRLVRRPDYFVRYPGLWKGGEQHAGAAVFGVSEGGVIQWGRPATDEEKRRLGSQPNTVLSVDETALGRNGLRLVVKRNGNWALGDNGKRWLEILLYH